MATPHYPDVAPELKWNPPKTFGPYRQAPAEHGGEWWYVSPFNQQPWLTETPKPKELPDGFERIFGPRPQSAEFGNAFTYRAALAEWEQDLKHFRGAGLPPGIEQSQVDEVNEVFEAWGMGKVALYQGRYGWTARFPDSQMKDFEATSIKGLFLAPHVVVSQYQAMLLLEGIVPAKLHPFTPPHLVESATNPT